MKPTTLVTNWPSTDWPSTGWPSTGWPSITELERAAAQTMPLPQITPTGIAPGESVRHILLGSPEAIRQTIHLLHTLRYSETVLWSPVLKVEEPIIVTPAQGEAMSLLRKRL